MTRFGWGCVYFAMSAEVICTFCGCGSSIGWLPLPPVVVVKWVLSISSSHTCWDHARTVEDSLTLVAERYNDFVVAIVVSACWLLLCAIGGGWVQLSINGQFWYGRWNLVISSYHSKTLPANFFALITSLFKPICGRSGSVTNRCHFQ